MNGMDMGVQPRLGSFAVLRWPLGGDDGGDDAAGRGSGCRAMRSGQRPRTRCAALRRVLPRRLGTRRRRAVCGVPAARVPRRRRGCDRGRWLRAHAGQAALPQALPRKREHRAGVRALLRRLEHRANADAGGAGRHERHLDVRDRRPCVAQKLLPPKAVIDVPLALAILGLGVLILIVPSVVPGLTPPM